MSKSYPKLIQLGIILVLWHCMNGKFLRLLSSMQKVGELLVKSLSLAFLPSVGTIKV